MSALPIAERFSRLSSDDQLVDFRAAEGLFEAIGTEIINRHVLAPDCLHMPAHGLWCEFPGYAMLLKTGEGDSVSIAAVDTRGYTFLQASVRLDPVRAYQQAVLADVHRPGSLAYKEPDCIQGTMRVGALAVLQIINSRSLISLEVRRHTRAARRRAERQGQRLPFSSWSEITLRSGRRPIVARVNGDTSGSMPWHFVLGHNRHVAGRQNPPRWIEGYWRGDEANGVRHHRYRIDASQRAEGHGG